MPKTWDYRAFPVSTEGGWYVANGNINASECILLIGLLTGSKVWKTDQVEKPSFKITANSQG